MPSSTAPWPWLPRFDLSLLGPTERTDGNPVEVNLDLTIEWDIEFIVTNNWSSPTWFSYGVLTDLTPTIGDCTLNDVLSTIGIPEIS